MRSVRYAVAAVSSVWSEYTRRVVGLLVGVLILFILWLARGVLAPLIVAGVIAFLIEPLVRGLQRIRVPRILGALLVLLVLLALCALIVAVLTPVLIDQFSQVRFNVDDALRSLAAWLRDVSDAFRNFNLFGYSMDLNPYVDEFQRRLDPAALADLLPSGQDLFGSATGLLTATAGTLVSFASTLGSLLFTLFLTFIYTLYLVSDGPRLAAGVRGLIPPAHHAELEALLARIARVWRAYFRGQLLMVTLFGTMVGLSLWLLGLPGALILGILAGVMDLVPSLGALVAGGLTVIMALIQGSTHLDINNLVFAAVVLGVYLGLQQLEASVLQPRIMGRSVELPGIVIMVGIVVGASVAGILGAYLAVPVMATGRIVFLYVYGKLTDEAAAADTGGGPAAPAEAAITGLGGGPAAPAEAAATAVPAPAPAGTPPQPGEAPPGSSS
ncbi:MAG: AI-2E family transporter [Thermoleophilia bacterium]